MFNDIDHDYKTLDAARKAAVNNYKIGDYWTVSTIYYGPKKGHGKHAGTVYLPGWTGFDTQEFIGIWMPTNKGGTGHAVTKARFVNRNGTLGKTAYPFYLAHRRK